MRGMQKGFTLIELLIVIAIILIIAALAIPNLLLSRIKKNEANAIVALRSYAEAQKAFKNDRLGRVSSNTQAGADGYADNFRNLFYGNPVIAGPGDGSVDATRTIGLIAKEMADAFVVDNAANGASTVANPTVPGPAVPYQGYLFVEAPEFRADAAVSGDIAPSFANDFGLVAYPVKANETGRRAYWIGAQGKVYSLDLAADVLAADAMNEPTPTSGSIMGAWKLAD